MIWLDERNHDGVVDAYGGLVFLSMVSFRKLTHWLIRVIIDVVTIVVSDIILRGHQMAKVHDRGTTVVVSFFCVVSQCFNGSMLKPKALHPIILDSKTVDISFLLLPELGNEVRASTTQDGRASQRRIDEISEQTRDLLTQYKQVMKIVDGLRVYNEQQERLIKVQEKELRELEESIDNVTVIERQMGPLIERMIANLDKFVELDVPFLASERSERIAFLKDTFDTLCYFLFGLGISFNQLSFIPICYQCRRVIW